ncbi:uncharacterized protein [Diadema antillarum]|uniref:uncharacterized protein n=1 Tax=Diadema antillarum TaxID=105358 RepID=UPI003A89A85B
MAKSELSIKISRSDLKQKTADNDQVVDIAFERDGAAENVGHPTCVDREYLKKKDPSEAQKPEGDVRSSSKTEEAIQSSTTKGSVAGDIDDQFNAISILEDKLQKSQRTIKALNKTNTSYKDELTRVTETLADESSSRQLLREELDASRKLCCELYEHLLTERSAKRRSHDVDEVERHLLPENFQYALSDAAVQTDDYTVPNSQLNSAKSKLCASTIQDHECSGQLNQAQNGPRSDLYLFRLLEEYQETQKHMETQLTNLSLQCRDKDASLKETKEKLVGHIRLNSLLQSDKACLEDAISRLRDEVQSCDRLVAQCEGVLREKEREVKELQESKFELERRVAEFEFKEAELQKMASSLQDDIGDLAAERKRLRKCVKKASRQPSHQQAKLVKPERADSREVELQTKAQLLDAIREIAFNRPSLASERDTPRPRGTKETSVVLTQRQVNQQGDDDKSRRMQSYTTCSVAKSVLITAGEDTVLLQRTSSHSISQETLPSIATKDAGATLENAEENQESAGPLCDSSEDISECSVDSLQPGGSKKRHTAWQELRAKRQAREQLQRCPWDYHASDTTSQASSCLCKSSPLQAGHCEDCEVSSSCQRLYGDVINELQCRNALDAASNSSSLPRFGMNDTPLRQGTPSLDAEQKSKNSPRASGHRTSSSRSSFQGKGVGTVQDRYGDIGTNGKTLAGKGDHIVRYQRDTPQQACSSNNSNDSNRDDNQGSPLTVGDGEIAKCRVPDVESLMGETSPVGIQAVGLESDFLATKQEVAVGNDMKKDDAHEQRFSHEVANDDFDSNEDLQFRGGREKYGDKPVSLSSESDMDHELGETDYGIDDTNDEDFQDIQPLDEGSLETLEDGWTSSEDEEELRQVAYANTFRKGTARPPAQPQTRPHQHSENDSMVERSSEEDIVGKMQKNAVIEQHFSNSAVDHQGLCIAGNLKQDAKAGLRKPGDRIILYPQRSKPQLNPTSARDASEGPNNRLEGLAQSRVHRRPQRHCRVGCVDATATQDTDLGASRLRRVQKLTYKDACLSDEDSLSDEEAEYGAGENSPVAEGLMLRKKVMDNYATRAKDRSWRFVYLVQDGPTLMFYKDQRKKTLGVPLQDPVRLTNAIVAVAKDYYARQHVFRLQLPSGCQYLFEAHDARRMMYWVCRLDAAAAVASTGLMLLPTQSHRGSASTAASVRPQRPATITTAPPEENGSPSKTQRLRNFIKGGMSVLRK